jgi:hypothetical protein
MEAIIQRVKKHWTGGKTRTGANWFELTRVTRSALQKIQLIPFPE